ncbi:hypothetical protein GCM10022402_28140 [Salinactinospora qingdaonensis]|uniref:Uncharacterized protein n=1 Tax=Salinactinospora qingdaonensis TaxID=702744 RepID=A0ABP7FTW3_9ACTN
MALSIRSTSTLIGPGRCWTAIPAAAVRKITAPSLRAKLTGSTSGAAPSEPTKAARPTPPREIRLRRSLAESPWISGTGIAVTELAGRRVAVEPQQAVRGGLQRLCQAVERVPAEAGRGLLQIRHAVGAHPPAFDHLGAAQPKFAAALPDTAPDVVCRRV